MTALSISTATDQAKYKVEKCYCKLTFFVDVD